MKATMNAKELLGALDELEVQKGIDRDYVLESLKNGLELAYKKNFDSEENVEIDINKETGKIGVFAKKEVVEKVEDSILQVDIDEARKKNKKAEVGDIVNIEVTPRDFGRIAAQTAKQIVLQKIREYERDMVYAQYSSKIGTIVTGSIQKVEKTFVIIELGNTEAIMPLKEQVPTEIYVPNTRIKVYLSEVNKGSRGATQVIVSRTNQGLVAKLFELEVPEIAEGIITIKNIVREAGSRTKIAVYSEDENIDPIGSCIGKKGMRIQPIIDELNGERIDVIPYSDDIASYIINALAPAQILAIDLIEEEAMATVVVPDDQLSLAIGKEGQNVRLAANLTGWKIDIKSETQIKQVVVE